VPAINEWDDYLLRFRGSKHDHPGEHLLKFHAYMLDHGFFHEDVWIKMLSFSLEEDALGWCLSLPAASIHSLKDFHDAFNSYYGKIYPAHLIFDDYCKRFSLHILQMIECSSCDESGKDLIERESEDESEYLANMDEKFSLSISQEEVLPDVIDDSIDDGITMDALFSAPSTPVVSDLKEEMVEEKNQDITLFSLQDRRVLRSPTPEEYSEAESIGCQSSYESESSYQEQHDREKEPSMDIHEETSFSHLEDVIRADKGEMEELKVQFISYLEPANEKVSPGISRPTSVLYPPVHSENIERQVSNQEVQEVISCQLRFPDYKLCDPVGLYMELRFPKALEPTRLFILSSLRGMVGVPNHVLILMSYFPYLLWIICSEENNYITEQSGWLWWKFDFT
jgi:hypothetical protein